MRPAVADSRILPVSRVATKPCPLPGLSGRRAMNRAALLLWMAVLSAMYACAPAVRRSGDLTAPPVLVETRPDAGLAERLAVRAMRDEEAVARAINLSLEYVRTRKPEERPFGAGGPDVTWERVRESLKHLRAVLPGLKTDPDVLLRDFVWYEVIPGPLMTGYYEPEMDGSLAPHPGFPAPIYGLPRSLESVGLGAFHPRWKGQTLVYRVEQGQIRPFFTRREIDTEKRLTDAPIAWTRSPVDVYFLQVQGSGRLRLPDGRVRHVLYAGKNGHEYVSLGKVLIGRGLVPGEEMSMQRIRRYLAGHPEQVEELLNANPSYVFFRLAEDGPFGAMGRALTPMVSMATDPAFLPLGSILAVDAVLPGRENGSAAFLGLAQDRGGAIKGSRLDLFCGAGQDAEFLAGHLQARPRVFLLLKK